MIRKNLSMIIFGGIAVRYWILKVLGTEELKVYERERGKVDPNGSPDIDFLVFDKETFMAIDELIRIIKPSHLGIYLLLPSMKKYKDREGKIVRMLLYAVKRDLVEKIDPTTFLVLLRGYMKFFGAESDIDNYESFKKALNALSNIELLVVRPEVLLEMKALSYKSDPRRKKDLVDIEYLSKVLLNEKQQKEIKEDYSFLYQIRDAVVFTIALSSLRPYLGRQQYLCQ